jgi:U3 small nucleolar RNA-associated protein 3
LYDENDLTVGEKRGTTWAMLSNKGLTPHRKKEDRNPRVKKRLKYEKAKKKLKSVRAVAVDKSKVGAYGGELTGIKPNLAKSIRF